MMLSTQKTKTRTMTRRKRTMKKQQTLEDLNNAVEKAYLDEKMRDTTAYHSQNFAQDRKDDGKMN